jgi:phosphoribosylanthranilate isomerase
MNYPFILKFSCISNLSDARYAAGAWADFIGFCFDPSLPDYIEPAKASEIAGWINGPLITGEFGHQPIEWIQDFANATGLKAIEIPADYKDENIISLGLRIIIRAEEKTQTALMDKADLFITNDPEVYQFLKSAYDRPVIFSVNDMAIKADDFDGISFRGVREDKPGTRNHAMWNEVLEPFMG